MEEDQAAPERRSNGAPGSTEGDPPRCSPMDSIPPEIQAMILSTFAASGDGGPCSYVACRSVCIAWRALLPPNPAVAVELCNAAAREGCLAVLRWARENGCRWNESTCAEAARSGELRCPTVGEGERMSLGRTNLRRRGGEGAHGYAQVGSGKWLPMGRADLRLRGKGRTHEGAQVGKKEWVSLGYTDLQLRGGGGPHGYAHMGCWEWLSLGYLDACVCVDELVGAQVGKG